MIYGGNGYDPGNVSILLNAADWAGPGPAPPGRPPLHRPALSQQQGEPVTVLVAVSKPQAEYPLSMISADFQPNAVRQLPVETKTGQPAHPEATLTPRSMLTARHAQDAVFEGWGDRVLDVLAWNLWT